MPHVTWDPDIPPLFLRAHEGSIKGWVRNFFAGQAGELMQLVPDRISLSAMNSHGPVELRVARQRRGAEERVIVQPGSREDLTKMQEWARQHEGFEPEDFAGSGGRRVQ